MSWRDVWRGMQLSREMSVTRVSQSRVLELDCFTPEAKALLRATFRRAAFFGARLASTRHLVVEAFDREPALAQCVSELGLDVDVVRDAVAAPLGDEEPSTSMEAVAAVQADRLLWIVAVVAREQQRGSGAACSARSLVSHALTFDALLAQELASFGVSRHALAMWFTWSTFAHEPIDEDAFAGEEVLDVWLDNDDRTPMDFVVDVLRGDLGLTRAEAQRHMLAVHERGASRVATFPRLEAIARANAVLERARAADHPLRVRVRPP